MDISQLNEEENKDSDKASRVHELLLLCIPVDSRQGKNAFAAAEEALDNSDCPVANLAVAWENLKRCVQPEATLLLMVNQEKWSSFQMQCRQDPLSCINILKDMKDALGRQGKVIVEKSSCRRCCSQSLTDMSSRDQC